LELAFQDELKEHL